MIPKYILELHNSSGQLVAMIEKAHNISYTREINVSPKLGFDTPPNDAKVSGLARNSEIWLRNYATKEVLDKFLPYHEGDIREGLVSKKIIAEGLMSQLAGEYVPSYDSTGKTLDTIITELLALQRNSNPITKGTIEPTWQDLSGWVSPTSHLDPGGVWANEPNAYDNNEFTSATTVVDQAAWGNFLQLYHAGIIADKIKILWYKSSSQSGMKIDLDAEWDGAWRDIFFGDLSGGYPTYSVLEKELGYTKTVTGIRARFFNGGTLGPVTFYFTEGYIWGVEGGKLSIESQSLLWALLQLHDIVGEGFIYVDNDRQLHWLNDIGENKGQQVRYRKNLAGIAKEKDWSSLVTRLYPIGNETALSDLIVIKETADKSSDATYGYLKLSSLYSCYKDWVGAGSTLPSHVKVYKNDVDDTATWKQGADERTLRCAIASYTAGATYTVTYKRADYLIAWDVVSQYGIITQSWTSKTIGLPTTLLELGRLKLTELKTPLVTYRISAADLSESEGFEFDKLQLGSIVTVIDEELGINVPVRAILIAKPTLDKAPQRMDIELSTRTKTLADMLVDMYRQLG